MTKMLNPFSIAWALILASNTILAADGAETNWVRVQFPESDRPLANPGQGWMSQDRSANAHPRFPCSVIYFRFNWADVEPEPGRYNWQAIDKVIEAGKARGATVAFRVMTCNAHSSGYYASPKWLFDAGCKGFEYLVGGDDPTSGGSRIARIEPDYSDPMYLKRHGEFLAALGHRYNGSPNVELLDIGSYGVWGEWHTTHPAPVSVRKQIVDLYLSAFPNTPLVFMSDDDEVLDYALARGTGFRRDGVGSPWHEENWIGSKRYAAVRGMADTWKKAPVVFEWFGNYDYLKSKNWSVDAAVNFMLNNHVTLINDNVGRVPPEAMPLMDKLARLAGARLVLGELGHTQQLKPGQNLHVSISLSNVGAGKLYQPYVLRLSLMDASGRVCASGDSKSDPRTWLPGKYALDQFLPIPATVTPGEYTLAMALVDPNGQRRPFQLAIDAPQENGRYAVSRVTVQAGN